MTSASTDVETTEPWPPGSTPEEQQAATAAIKAVNGYNAVVTAAQADPAGKDWEPEIRQYLADPAATELVRSIKSLVLGGVRQSAAATYSDGRATFIAADHVTVVTCVDRTKVQVVDRSDQPVDLPIVAPRGLSTLEVRDFGDGQGWLVVNVSGIDESLPC